MRIGSDATSWTAQLWLSLQKPVRAGASPTLQRSMFLNSVSVFQHGPVSRLTCSDDSITSKEDKRRAFMNGDYTVAIVPLNAFEGPAPHAQSWFHDHFAAASDGVDETPYFKGQTWSRTGKPLVVPTYNLQDYMTHHGGGNAALPGSTNLHDVLPYDAFLPYIPELCTDLELTCKTVLCSPSGVFARQYCTI